MEQPRPLSRLRAAFRGVFGSLMQPVAQVGRQLGRLLRGVQQLRLAEDRA
jgi:hypothetical protein